MRIAVTDACIFIDLLESNACSAFFQLQFEIITTRQVWMELETEQRETLKPWINTKKLRIITGIDNVIKIRDEYNLSKALSIADLSVWTLTLNKKAILLTSDGKLRKMAKQHQIETHGLLWVFNEMVEQKELSFNEAKEKLYLVFEQNTHYKSDQKLYNAFEHLLSKWRNS